MLSYSGCLSSLRGSAGADALLCGKRGEGGCRVELLKGDRLNAQDPPPALGGCSPLFGLERESAELREQTKGL